MKAQSKTDDAARKLQANDDMNAYLKNLAGGESKKRRTIGNLLMEDPARVGDGHDGKPHVKELSFSGYERNPIFYNTGGKFEDIGGALGAAMLDDGRGVVAADLDGDGDDDIVLRNVFSPHAVAFRNDVAREPQLVVRLKGTKTNRFGIGARVTIRGNDLVRSDWIGCGIGYLSCRPPEAHFGLGGRRVTVEVKWPTGEISKAADIGPGILVIDEGGQTPAFEPAGAAAGPPVVEWPRLIRSGDVPALDAVDLRREPFKVSALAGKVHILHFWSVRCVSCREEIQRYPEYVKACRDAGIEVVSVNIDGGPAAFAQYEPKGGWPAPVHVLAAGIEHWQPDVEPVLPLHVIVGADGRVIDRIVGTLEPEDLVALVKAAQR